MSLATYSNLQAQIANWLARDDLTVYIPDFIPWFECAAARFTLPEPGQGLGHQLEYSANQIQWQIERAELDLVLLEHDELGCVGHSRKAQIARKLLSPFKMRRIWRDGLVAAARKSHEAA